MSERPDEVIEARAQARATPWMVSGAQVETILDALEVAERERDEAAKLLRKCVSQDHAPPRKQIWDFLAALAGSEGGSE